MRRAASALSAALLVAACAGGGESAAPSTTTATEPTRSPTSTSAAPATTTTTAPPPTTTTAPPAASPRPAWLGTRPLPLRPDGFGVVLPTPPELDPRDLESPAWLPPPGEGAFTSAVHPVPADVAARSTWDPACPVALDDLRYLTASFWGFDDRVHTGELILHADVADDVVGVLRALFDARFPIEEMRVIGRDELDIPPTGDGNVTTGFVCRAVTGGSSWSEHAYGRAIDVNPFQNPYARGDVVLPELATTYVDRADVRPGMVVAGDVVVRAFAAVGWEWGGAWSSFRDWMHFSTTGR